MTIRDINTSRLHWHWPDAESASCISLRGSMRRGGITLKAINADPIIGRSTAFPAAKATTDKGWTYVACEAGECLQGNLFNDAMRWFTKSDFSFTNSGAYHGLGWPEGRVRVSDIWNTLPL